MRFGPILVPSAIAVAIGVIVAAESGWLDGAPDPVVIRSQASIDGTASRKATLSRPRSGALVVSEGPTSIGRSVGKQAAVPPRPVAYGSGGAGLEADGITSPPQPAAPASPQTDGLQQARDEAAKAKQDVLDVTRASLESQKASESEFEREKSELDGKISRLQAQLDAAAATAGGVTDPKGHGDDVARAEAKAATAEAELADAHQRENTLRTQLAELHGATSAPDAKTASEAKAATDQALHQAESRAKDLGDKVEALQKELAAGKAETARADAAAGALNEARQHSLSLGRDVASLQARLAAGEIVSSKLAAAEKDRADGEARTKALEDRIAGLKTEATARDATVRQLSAAADAAKPLAGQLAAARQNAATLEDRIARLQRDETSGAAAREADTRTIAALKSQLDDSRLREQDLGAKFAATQRSDDGKRATAAKLDQAQHREAELVATIATLRDRLAGAEALATTPTAGVDVTKLQDDLSGARRGEATLRRENAVLQRELAETHSDARSLHEDAAQAARIPTPAPPGSRRPSSKRAEAAGRFGDRYPAAPRPSEPGPAEGRQTSTAVDPHVVIRQATALIRAGHVDQARQMLRSAKSPAATRALADTYNPLTNTQYGAIGVDSDADRASLLYQQAARPF